MTGNFLRRFAAGCATSFALAAQATNQGLDLTDLWWNADESGWGLNLIHQGDVLFGTFFVYGPDQTPRWYVASELAPQSASAGTAVYSGKLYSTTGPWFASAFNPNNVGVTEVGQATLTFGSGNSLLLTYTVNSVVVVKQLTRQTWRVNSPVGRYFPAGITAMASSCTGPPNGPAYFNGTMIATLTDTLATFRIDYIVSNTPRTCTLTGTWVQTGRLASVNGGAWSCVSGTNTLNQGTFTLSAIDVQFHGMTATFVASDQFCQYAGRLGGLRDVVN